MSRRYFSEDLDPSWEFGGDRPSDMDEKFEAICALTGMPIPLDDNGEFLLSMVDDQARLIKLLQEQIKSLKEHNASLIELLNCQTEEIKELTEERDQLIKDAAELYSDAAELHAELENEIKQGKAI